MLDDVINRLAGFGYTVTTADDWMLNFCVDKIVNKIKNNCNVPAVPEGLWERAVDLICGEFLYGKLAQGQIDVDAAVRLIEEGDTRVEFPDGLSTGEKYSKLVDDLRNTQIDFASFRRLKW